jgi:hypothetical protein
MNMNVGKLREELAGLPDDADIMLLFEGTPRYVDQVKVFKQGNILMIRAKGGLRKSKPYSLAEDGLINALAAMSISDEDIANLLDRPLDGLKKRKKQLGYH